MLTISSTGVVHVNCADPECHAYIGRMMEREIPQHLITEEQLNMPPLRVTVAQRIERSHLKESEARVRVPPVTPVNTGEKGGRENNEMSWMR